MDGIQIEPQAITGVLDGIGFSASALSLTLDNIYVWTIAVMFIGLSLGMGIAMYLLVGGSSRPRMVPGNGVSDAYYAHIYMERGGDIKHAANQEFIRAWAKENM